MLLRYHGGRIMTMTLFSVSAGLSQRECVGRIIRCMTVCDRKQMCRSGTEGKCTTAGRIDRRLYSKTSVRGVDCGPILSTVMSAITRNISLGGGIVRDQNGKRWSHREPVEVWQHARFLNSGAVHDGDGGSLSLQRLGVALQCCRERYAAYVSNCTRATAVHLGTHLPIHVKEIQTPITVPSPAFITSCHVCPFMSQCFFYCGFACMFRFASFVFHGDPCERRRPRPRDSSTPPDFTTASQRQEGQQLPLGTICHSDVPLWPVQRGRCGCLCVSRLHVGTTLRRLASAVDVGTRVRKGKARTTPQTHCQEHYQGVGQAVQRSALVRRKHPKWSEVENRQTSSDVPFVLLHEMLQHAVLKARSMTWLRPTPRHVRGAHTSEWT